VLKLVDHGFDDTWECDDDGRQCVDGMWECVDGGYKCGDDLWECVDDGWEFVGDRRAWVDVGYKCVDDMWECGDDGRVCLGHTLTCAVHGSRHASRSQTPNPTSQTPGAEAGGLRKACLECWDQCTASTRRTIDRWIYR